jgi:hypothetical protein
MDGRQAALHQPPLQLLPTPVRMSGYKNYNILYCQIFLVLRLGEWTSKIVFVMKCKGLSQKEKALHHRDQLVVVVMERIYGVYPWKTK